ncbi:NHLP bacteriocin system secretion protein [Scytonema sp. UIC 10036]|uniref:NHLP bacteriocin system secretion protein n=1 Tax=Scytonema sp. UIC 10036 TaxID=2304196 RepID=UPI0012DAC667|nr:NHLP bacteriocin system secretion protein [Scytonema sp. UIC 10036]MUG99338.1 NHLP bacteriocin system secretion protein [Scytonema sp. UIC 10036]
MPNKANKLFREKALEHLNSPEQLDRLMLLTSRHAWVPLASMGLLVFVAGTWSVIGRIPLTVTGSGVLIRPSHVVQFQSLGGGQLLTLNIKPGDIVRQGQVLATIDQSNIQQQLQQEKAKLAQLLVQKQNIDRLQKQQITLSQRTLSQQQKDLSESLRRESVAPTLHSETIRALEQKRQSLEQSLSRENVSPLLYKQTLAALAEKRKSLLKRSSKISSLLQTLQQRVEARRHLFQQKVISQDVVLQSVQDLLNQETQLSDIQTQLKDLEVQKTSTEREYLQNLNRIDDIKNNIQEILVQKTNADREYLQNLNKIDDIKTKIQDIEAQKTKLVQQDLEKSIGKLNQIQEVRRKIASLKLQLTQSSQIISKYDGRILSVGVLPGQIVSAGTRIGTIEAENPNTKLSSLVYFADKDGKQIKPGMSVQVIPSVVKRDRYGGIVGVVTNVSPFPVTTQDMTAQVGNEDLARSLANNHAARMQVIVQLQEDPSTTSGYKWSSSKGPALKISSGTTTQVRVKVGQVAPISYMIPILRSVTGIY